MRSPYESKPALRPNRRSSGKALTNAPVAKPAADSVVASEGTAASTRMPLCLAPCPGGYRPVISDACDGSVMGAVAKACSKRTPRAASPSMCRRPRARVAIGADAIGAQRVDGDEEEMARLGGSRWLRRRAPCNRCRRAADSNECSFARHRDDAVSRPVADQRLVQKPHQRDDGCERAEQRRVEVSAMASSAGNSRLARNCRCFRYSAAG